MLQKEQQMNNMSVTSSKSFWGDLFQKTYQKFTSLSLPAASSDKLKKFYFLSVLGITLMGFGKVGYEKWKENKIELKNLKEANSLYQNALKELGSKGSAKLASLSSKNRELTLASIMLLFKAAQGSKEAKDLLEKNSLLAVESQTIGETNEKLIQNHQEVGKLQEEIASYKTNIRSLTESKQGLEAQLTELRSSSNTEIESLKEQVSTIQEEIASYKTNIRSLTESKQSLEAQLTELHSSYNAEIESLRNKVRSLDILRDQKEGMIASLTKQVEELQDNQAFHDALMNKEKNKTIKAQNERNGYQIELETALHEKAALQEKLSEAAQLGSSLVEENEALQNKIATLQAKKTELEKTLQEATEILS